MTVSIHLYAGGDESMDLSEIKDYLSHLLPNAAVDIRGEFIAHHGGDIDELSEKIAETRVSDPSKPFTPNQPLYGEIEYEKKILSGKGGGGILYDGLELTAIYHELLPEGEAGLTHVHVAFTDRLIGTFDEDDLRYHARVNVCSAPSIISATGVVEAPAKPREFYAAKQMAGGDQLAVAKIKQDYAGQFIDYDDPRLTDVAKGYVMQAVVYQLTGTAFCENPKCRLFNSHWQAEVITAQLSEADFCARHEKTVNELGGKPSA